MKIKCFVERDYMTVDPFSGINVVKKELLNQKAIVIQENENYLGTLTATDILRRPHNLVIDCMTDKQQITTDYSVYETLQVMKEKLTDVLPVYQNDHFFGLIYKSDLLEYLTEYTNELHEKVSVKTSELQKLTENLENIVIDKTLELQKLNSTKDKFFSIIAHDLKSPFNSIMGFSSLLEENAKLYAPEKIERYSKIINNTSRQTFELLENLLEWSNSQRDEISFCPKRVDTKGITDFVIKGLNSLAKNKGIKLFHNIKNSVYVHADINMLKTILRNLIYNSIKFTNNDGEVCIESKEIENYVTISVTDTGIGMRKTQIKKLFKIEEQISTIGTNNEKGSGFGLILCKEFVERHGGKILVESEEGKGSCFSFTIPQKKGISLTST